MLIELRLWRSFVVLADELNFRRAADRLGVSQPALTKQMKELEDRLGAVLFRREPRGVERTEAAVAALPGARALLDAAARLERQVREAQDTTAGAVTIGALEYVARGMLPGAIARARGHEPTLRVTVQDMTLAAAEAAAADGRVDLGLAIAPVREPVLVAKPLVSGCWMVVMPSDHRLASDDSVPVEALAREPLILFARRAGPDRYDALVRMLEARAKGFTIAYHAQDPLVGPEMTASGVGLFLAASYVLPALPAALVARPVDGLGEPLTLCLVWRRDRMRPALRALIDGFLAGVDDR